MRKGEIAALSIVVISFLIGVYFYPTVSEKMASHWGIEEEVNGYMPKFWGLFLMPIVSFCLFLLFIAIPRIDPLKQNIVKFRKYFDGFVVIILLFLLYLDLLTIFWNLGFTFNIIQFLIPSFSILFFYIGILLDKSKRNWFIGIRTPWTMTSDKIWEKTNKLGGKLFKILGFIILIGIIFVDYAFYFILVIMFSVVFYTFTYSYFEYKKTARKK